MGRAIVGSGGGRIVGWGWGSRIVGSGGGAPSLVREGVFGDGVFGGRPYRVLGRFWRET
jgi:hypothetical protein